MESKTDTSASAATGTDGDTEAGAEATLARDVTELRGPAAGQSARVKYERATAADGWTTIIGFGSLLSERSARFTCPALRNFRLAQVNGYRRVFIHTSEFVFESGLVERGQLQCAGSSAEPWPVPSADDDAAPSPQPMFVTVFDIPKADLPAFFHRERGYIIEECPFYDVLAKGTDDDDESKGDPALQEPAGYGLFCLAASTEYFVSTRGEGALARFEKTTGFPVVWEIPGVLPSSLYLRHCLLAAKSHSEAVFDNFVATTFLRDRRTTIGAYLKDTPEVWDAVVPEAFSERYNG